MSVIYYIQIIIFIVSIICSTSCFIYMLFKLPKYFILVGWFYIVILAIFLSLMWPLVFLYNLITLYMEKFSGNKP